MKNFIYDRYGYYLNEEENFTYQGFDFVLEINNKTDLESEEMNNFIINLSSSLYDKKAYIVPSKENKLITLSEYGNVSLVGVEHFDVNLDDIIKLHSFSLKNDTKYKLTYVKELWIKKLNLIEQIIIPSVKIEEYYYQLLIICVTHGIGLATNAISYLEDLIVDYKESITITSLTHKRLKLNSYDLLNPFNLVIDSPLRDYAELYKNDIVTFEELILLFSLHPFTSKDYSYFMARLLFPSTLFDMLEKHYQKRDDLTEDLNDYYLNINIQIEKIKKIHSYLVSNYGIRKINWLF